MRVIKKYWMGRPIEMDLEAALEIDSGEFDRGALESVESLSLNTSRAVSRLTARLVELKIISLDEAKEICGVDAEITVL